MQAALTFAPPLCPLTPSKSFSTHRSFSPKLAGPIASRSSAIKATAVAYDTSTVDYSSMFSVFPAEACETIGGEACVADIYPEVKFQPEARNNRRASEFIDREYLEYNDSKTVFRAEACDALGGKFCGREYQRGVY
ncbi:hypothetical protein L1049_001868 [Liquidambar formosana]|uniref:Light-regulated protein n=1 Tax=Liquidambar formosana TaxID=63359 RepID=A0AAP0NEY0_LIQFO